MEKIYKYKGKVEFEGYDIDPAYNICKIIDRIIKETNSKMIICKIDLIKEKNDKSV